MHESEQTLEIVETEPFKYDGSRDMALDAMKNRLQYLSDKMSEGWHTAEYGKKTIIEHTINQVSGLYHHMNENEQEFFLDALESMKEQKPITITIQSE